MSNQLSTNEVWETIPGYSGMYMASDLGNIKSCERYVKHSKGGFQILRESILKKTTVKSGYQTVALSVNGKPKTKLVHRLVISAFLGTSELVVDHIDTNKSNNSLSNLRYCTQRDNLCFGKTNPGVSINPSKYKKRFRSRINIGGKLKELGSYADLHTASQVYQLFKNNLQNGK